MSAECEQACLRFEVGQKAGRAPQRYTVSAYHGGDRVYFDDVTVTNRSKGNQFIERAVREAVQRGVAVDSRRCEQAFFAEVDRFLAAAEQAEPARAPAVADPERILCDLGITVLGESKDGSVHVWNPATRKLTRVARVAYWQAADIVQTVGERAVEYVSLTLDGNGRRTGVYSVDDVRLAVARTAARRRRIDESRWFGQGVWPTGHGRLLLIVNGAQAAIYDGQRLRRVETPVLGGKLIQLDGSQRWRRRLGQRVRDMTPERAAGLFEQLGAIVRQWYWRHPADAEVAAGLVAATFVQAT